MTARTSIARLADCAPVASPESWVARKVPGTHWVEIRHPYIDDTPAINAAHAAIEAEARATAQHEIEASAEMYATNPRYLDTIAQGLSNLSPQDLITALDQIDSLALMRGRRWVGCGGEIPSFNLQAAKVYAARRYAAHRAAPPRSASQRNAMYKAAVAAEEQTP